MSEKTDAGQYESKKANRVGRPSKRVLKSVGGRKTEVPSTEIGSQVFPEITANCDAFFHCSPNDTVVPELTEVLCSVVPVVPARGSMVHHGCFGTC